ncbi:phosphatase PAP2 family protein [Planococcus donghaensis]|uniref:phosphatase PAP2 family protein n=1 Tax=Planococcus donghaensis TaxID=414778 RepID=UPI002355BA10|nr:phosphatase PAP2 family protein [Planococcus donghaensis]
MVIGGGEIYEECLRRIFHNFSPLNQTLENLWYSFPSEQSLMTFVIYGIVVFILVRTIEKVSVRTFFPFVIFILLMLISISRMYLELELPSDILAGYVFGGVWLGFTIFTFEFLLLLKNSKTTNSVFKRKANL